jgi:dienelactone hydrolase
VASPWDRFVTVVPGEGSVTLTTAGGASTTLAAPSVDYGANSIVVRVPGGAPATGVLQLNGGAGLWAAGAWVSDPGVVDLFFNLEDLEPKGNNFRSDAQAEAIASGDVSAFSQDLDLGRLAAGVADPAVFTEPGTHNAVFKSRQNLGEGYGEGFPKYNGLYQPYALWLPENLDPNASTPLVLVLHSLSNHHNQYARTVYPQVAGSLGAIAITPLALGVDGWYWDEGLVDTLDAWADVRRRYAIDADRTLSSGYSMGGYGTYRLGTIVPDLLTAGISWVGPPTDGIWTGSPTTVDAGLTYDQIENTYNVPFFIVHGTFDELVPVTGVTRQAERFKELGHEYRYNLHPGQDHLSFAIIDDWSREQQWVQGRRRVVDPARVTFKARPATWAGRDADVTAERRAAVLAHLDALTAELGGSSVDSAYWVRNVVVAGHDPVAWNDVTGSVDLTSHAIAARVPVTREATGAAAFGSSPHVVTGLDRFFVADPVAAPVENALSGSISGVSELTLDLRRAGLRLDGLDLNGVLTDGDVTLHLVDGTASKTVVLSAV